MLTWCVGLNITHVGMLFSLVNSVHRLKLMHKWLLYRSCVMPITLYGICLWYFDGAHLKGTMKELTKIQRQAAIWILGAFKCTPTGVVESLAGLILIHLQIQKLVYHNHVYMPTLADSYITWLMAATGDEAEFISVYHPSQLCNKCKSPLVDMWANKNLVNMFILPYNRYNVPGFCYDFSLLWTIMTYFLLITPTQLLLIHLIWHTYCALSQLDCRLSPYRLFLLWLLILTHFLWHLISDWLGLCARPISI